MMGNRYIELFLSNKEEVSSRSCLSRRRSCWRGASIDVLRICCAAVAKLDLDSEGLCLLAEVVLLRPPLCLWAEPCSVVERGLRSFKALSFLILIGPDWVAIIPFTTFLVTLL